MKHIAITTMNIYDESRKEWRDAIDRRWAELLYACNLIPLYLPNQPQVSQHLLTSVDPCGLLLSGGGDCSALTGRIDDRDETEAVALRWARQKGKPVLGVCRGMQVLISHFGGTLRPVENHVAVRHHLLYSQRPRHVNSFHGYGVSTLPEDFEITASAPDGVTEAARHRTLNLHAIMWHPEREAPPSEDDMLFIKSIFQTEA